MDASGQLQPERPQQVVHDAGGQSQQNRLGKQQQLL